MNNGAVGPPETCDLQRCSGASVRGPGWCPDMGMDGLLGVAGMMTLLVMTGIIPENSLRKTHQFL